MTREAADTLAVQLGELGFTATVAASTVFPSQFAVSILAFSNPFAALVAELDVARRTENWGIVEEVEDALRAVGT